MSKILPYILLGAATALWVIALSVPISMILNDAPRSDAAQAAAFTVGFAALALTMVAGFILSEGKL